MWGLISKAIGSIGGMNKNSLDQSRASLDISDDETCSNDSSDDGLECPICCESFNIVENVPYVLWCGHTLCKNCVLGLQLAVYKFSNQKIQIPFFISCPWCHLLTLRLVYKGNLKFPCKNYFLLWMVESLNGDRLKSHSFIAADSQRSSCTVNHSTSVNSRRSHRSGHSGSNSDDSNGVSGSVGLERTHSFHKSLDFFINLTVKIPLVALLLLIVLFVIPASVAILALYLLITVLFALPSFLVLYFAYPALEWLAREMAT